MGRWRSSEFWPRDVLPLPLIPVSICPKNGPTTRSDATKRASRRANGSLRPKANWPWKSPEQARRNGVRFGWVGADAGDGFLIDVHKSFVIYEVDPQSTIPGPSRNGRKASELTSGQQKRRGVRR